MTRIWHRLRRLFNRSKYVYVLCKDLGGWTTRSLYLTGTALTDENLAKAWTKGGIGYYREYHKVEIVDSIEVK